MIVTEKNPWPGLTRAFAFSFLNLASQLLALTSLDAGGPTGHLRLSASHYFSRLQ